MSTYGLAVTLTAPFESVVAATRTALADQGFGILTEIDVAATMKAKLDKNLEPYLILGACNPPLAHRAITIDSSIGLLLPCNVVVRALPDAAVLVEAMDPELMVRVTGVPALQEVADEAGSRLRAALEALRHDYRWGPDPER